MARSTRPATGNTLTGAELSGLRRRNRLLAVVYLAQAFAVALLATSVAYPVTVSYLTNDSLQSSAQGVDVLVQASQRLFDVQLAYVVALFLIVPAIAHALMAFRLRRVYERNLQQGRNVLYWVEHGVSVSFMLLAVALLAGVSDIALLVLLAVLPLLAHACGALLERRLPGSKPSLGLCWLGGVSTVLPGIVLAIYLTASQVLGSSVPLSLWTILVSIAILLIVKLRFVVASLRRADASPQFARTERAYTWLGLAARTVLAWQIFAGVLLP